MIGAQTGKAVTANEPKYGVHWRLMLEHADDVLYDFSNLSGVDWQESVEWGKNVDDAGCNVTIKLRREVDGLSLAPLVEGSPLNQVAGSYAKRVNMSRRFRVEVNITELGVAPDDAEWFVPLKGYTDKVSWGGKDGTIVINARDDLRLLDYLILTGEDTEWGTDEGMPMEDVASAILAHYLGDAAPTLVWTSPANFDVTKFKAEAGKKLKEVLDILVDHVGRYVESRWDTASGGFQITVMEPNRNSGAATPVATIGPEQYLSVNKAEWDLNSVRNYLKLRYRNSSSGDIETITITNEDSIEELGGFPIGVLPYERTEPEDSPIDTEEEAEAYLGFIAEDLSSPLVAQEVENLFWPWVELGDYIQWEPNFKTMDSAYVWAVVSFRHVLSRTQKRTFFGTSGQAKGGQKRHRRRENETRPTTENLALRRAVLRIKRIRKTDTFTELLPVVGPDVWRIVVYEQVWPLEDTERHDPTPEERVATLEPGQTYTAYAPEQGTEKVVYFVPMTEGFVIGDGMEYVVGPVSAQAEPYFDYIEQRTGGGIELRVVDPDNLGGDLEIWTNPSVSTDPTTAEAVDATLTLPSTPAIVLPSASPALTGITIHPTDGKTAIFRFTNTNGVSTGYRAFYMHGSSTLVTIDDKLKADAVERENILALAVNDLKIAALAITNAKIALAAVDTANVVDAAMTAVKVATSAITEIKVADLAVSAAKLASLSVTNAKLVDDAVTSVKLGSQAVTTAKMGLLAVTDAILAANAVTETKITDTAVTTNKVAASAIVAGKIAGSAVTTDKLDALAVTTEKLAALAVTAERIAANAVVAGKLAADSVQAANIAAGQILTGHITALAITSDLLAAGAVIAGKVAANAITADEIAANAITSGKIAAGAIIAGKISAGAIDATNIIANGIITNDLIAAGTITAAKLVALTITADKIAGLTITGDKISSNTITADKITVSDLSAINANFTGHLKLVEGGSGNDVGFYTGSTKMGSIYAHDYGSGTHGIRVVNQAGGSVLEIKTYGGLGFTPQATFQSGVTIAMAGALSREARLVLNFDTLGERVVAYSGDLVDGDGYPVLVAKTV